MKKLSNLLILFTCFGVCLKAQSSEIFSGEELFKTPFYTSPKISPDGKFVVGRTNDGTKRELVITDPKTGEAHPVVFFAKGNFLTDFYWIDNNSLYIEYRSGKKDRQSIINLDTDDLATKRSAHRIKANGYLLNALPEEADQVLFVRQYSDEKLEIVRIHTTDLVNNNFHSATTIKNQLPNANLYVYDQQKRAFFGLKFDSENETFEVWFMASEQEAWRLLYRSDNLEYQFKALQYIGDNKFLILTNQTTDRVVVAEFNLISQKVDKIVYEHPQFDIVDAELDETTGELTSITYFEKGMQKVEYFQTEDAEFQNMLIDSEDDDPIYVVDTSLDKSKSILYAYGSAHPGTYVLFNEKTQRTKLIAHSYPNLIEQEFAKTRKVDITLPSGETKEAYLTLPYLRGNGVLLVILRNDTTGSNIETLTEFSKSVQYLANRGYAVLRINHPAHLNVSQNENESVAIEFTQDIEQDIHHIVTEIKQEYGYEKSCPVGLGYSAYPAVKLPILYPDSYDCVIGLYGIYDYQLLFTDRNTLSDKINQKGLKNALTEAGMEVIKQSPVYTANNFTHPILLVAGSEDNIAVPEQVKRLNYVLSKQSENVELLIYEGKGHGTSSWYQEQQLHAIIDDFLRRHLALKSLETTGDASEVAKEYVKIADVYDYDNLTENDKKKSFEYYVRAAKLGHPRAMFNYGSYFHRGEFVDLDMDNAVQWYEKASEAGYDSASYRLGMLFSEGSLVTKDILKSHAYFTLADKQGFDARAGIQMAKELCTGINIPRDELKCMNLLNLAKIKEDNRQNRTVKVTDESKTMLHRSLGALMLAPDNTYKQRQFYKRILFDDFKIVDTPYTFELVEEGIFSKQGWRGHRKTTYDIQAKAGVNIGIRFNINTTNTYNQKKGVLVRITKRTESGDAVPIYRTVVHNNSQKDWYIKTTLTEDDLSTARYHFEIFNLDKKLLYEQSFSVIGK